MHKSSGKQSKRSNKEEFELHLSSAAPPLSLIYFAALLSFPFCLCSAPEESDPFVGLVLLIFSGSSLNIKPAVTGISSLP